MGSKALQHEIDIDPAVSDTCSLTLVYRLVGQQKEYCCFLFFPQKGSSNPMQSDQYSTELLVDIIWIGLPYHPRYRTIKGPAAKRTGGKGALWILPQRQTGLVKQRPGIGPAARASSFFFCRGGAQERVARYGGGGTLSLTLFCRHDAAAAAAKVRRAIKCPQTIDLEAKLMGPYSV